VVENGGGIEALRGGVSQAILWHQPFEKLQTSSDDGQHLLWLDFGDDGEQVRNVLGDHSPGKHGKVNELKSGRGKRKSQRKCVLACGQLPRVLFLTQNMQERSSLLDNVLRIEHSCHSYERI